MSCLCRCVIPLGLAVAGYLTGDTDGGSRRPKTPYVGDQVNEAQVAAMKKAASQTREIHGVPLLNGRRLSARNVGLMYERDPPGSGPAWTIEGTDTANKKVSVDLSVVSKMWLVELKKNLLSPDTAVLEIEVFPEITVGDLVQKKPTYSDLLDDYTRVVRVLVAVEASGKGDLWLVGKENGDSQYHMVAKLRDLKPQTEIQLDFGVVEVDRLAKPCIWWATPSVIADKNYPLVNIMKR